MVDYVTTHVDIDKHKKKLAKQIAEKNGITFKEFINNAITMALGIETKGTEELLNEKEMLEKELNLLNERKITTIDKFNSEEQLLLSKIEAINNAINDAKIVETEQSQSDEIKRMALSICNGKTIADLSDDMDSYCNKYGVSADSLKKDILKEVDNIVLNK